MLDVKRIPHFSNSTKEFCLKCRPLYQNQARRHLEKESKLKSKIEKLFQSNQKLREKLKTNRKTLKKLQKTIKLEPPLNSPKSPPKTAKNVPQPKDQDESSEELLSDLSAEEGKSAKIAPKPSQPFIRRFVEGEKLNFCELNNEVIETFEVPLNAIKNARFIEETIRDAKTQFGLKSLHWDESPQRTISFRLRGSSNSVRAARSKLGQSLQMRIRLIRRFLIIPADYADQIDCPQLQKLAQEDSLHKCVVSKSPPAAESAFGKRLADSGLGQIEAAGFPSSCDRAEEAVAAFAKRRLAEPDASLSLPDAACAFLTESRNLRKIRADSLCEAERAQTGGISVFAGSALGLEKAIAAIEALYKSFANKKLREEIKIPKVCRKAVDSALVANLLSLAAFSLSERLSAEVKDSSLILTATAQADCSAFCKAAEFLSKAIIPKEKFRAKRSKKKLLERSESFLKEKRALLAVEEEGSPGKSDFVDCFIFSEKAEDALAARKALQKIVSKKAAETVKLSPHQRAAFSDAETDRIESEFGVVLCLKERRRSEDLRGALLVKIYAAEGGDEVKCYDAAKEVAVVAEKMDFGEPALATEIPRSREPMASAKLLERLENEFSVKIKLCSTRDKSPSEADKNKVCCKIWGEPSHCEKASEALKRHCLVGVEPSKRVGVTPEKATRLFGGDGGNIEKIKAETGCLLFLEAKEGEEVVELYGNMHACEEALKRVELFAQIDRKPDRILLLPQSDLGHIRDEEGRKLRALEESSHCEIVIPSVLKRDPLDNDVQISIYGPHEDAVSEAESGLRKLTSLLTKVENKITRIREITPLMANMLEKNDSKLIFLIQDETRCILKVEKLDGEGSSPKLFLKGSQITCDAAELRLKQICT